MPHELRAARARACGDGLDARAGAGGRLRATRLATDCAAAAATQLLVVEFWHGSAALGRGRGRRRAGDRSVFPGTTATRAPADKRSDRSAGARADSACGRGR